jgi:hypothetical protein
VGFHRAVTTQLAATTAGDLTGECGEVTGGAPVAVEREPALAAGVGGFGPALVGFIAPQPGQVVELGYHLFAMYARTPALPVLYST